MTPEQTVAAVKDPIHGLGGAFMRNRATRERGTQLGVPGWAFYVAGRAGVLGNVDADVVAATMVFFPTPWVREHWEMARAVLQPDEAARQYAAACHRWGRERLAGAEGLDRLVELARGVVDGVEPAGLPLFAGWRALPLPDDDPARVAHLAMVLREHRGNLHALAVLAQGLSPLEAHVAGPLGAANAEFFGWPQPYPDPGPLADRWQAAEAATARLTAPAFAVLDESERAELAGLLGRSAETALRR
jgi:hypothetical protein